MSEGKRKVQGREVYTLVHASETPEERARLDSLHKAITAYFGGKLTLAPLETSPPRTILEMGAGSGAWAVHAATNYPDAKLLAVDLAEIPRPLPPNVTFHAADLTKPFDLEPTQFDLVHARLFFTTLPNPQTVVERSLHLVKPGGWMIIEDVDNRMYCDSSKLGPGLLKAFTTWSDIWKERGMNTRATRDFEWVLRESGQFSEIVVHKFSVPVSGQTEDPTLQQFGSTVRHALNFVYTYAYTQLSDPRFTEELLNEALKELNDEKQNIRIEFYFIWARKSM